MELVDVFMFVFDVHKYGEYYNTSVEERLRHELHRNWLAGGTQDSRLIIMLHNWAVQQKETPGGTERTATRSGKAYLEIPRWSKTPELLTALQELIRHSDCIESAPFPPLLLLRFCFEVIQPLELRAEHLARQRDLQ